MNLSGKLKGAGQRVEAWATRRNPPVWQTVTIGIVIIFLFLLIRAL